MKKRNGEKVLYDMLYAVCERQELALQIVIKIDERLGVFRPASLCGLCKNKESPLCPCYFDNSAEGTCRKYVFDSKKIEEVEEGVIREIMERIINEG